METLRGALSLILKTENANLMALLQESQEECPLGTNVCKKKINLMAIHLVGL